MSKWVLCYSYSTHCNHEQAWRCPCWCCARSNARRRGCVGRTLVRRANRGERARRRTARDGNRRNLYPDELFGSPTGSPASADRLHEEPGPSPAALGVCSRSSSGLKHPIESGVQLQLPKNALAHAATATWEPLPRFQVLGSACKRRSALERRFLRQKR